MRNGLVILVLCSCVIACGAPAAEDAGDAAADTISRGARDSAIARSRIPNARAVGKAQDAAQTSQQRTSTLDSMQAAMDSIQ